MLLQHPYVRLATARWRLALAIVIGCTLIAWGVSALILAQRPTFESAARLNIVPTSEELGYANRFVRGTNFDGGGTLLQTYAEFAHTRPIVAPIVDRWIGEQARRAGQSRAAWMAANSVAPAFSPRRIIADLNYGAAPAKPFRDDVIDTLIEDTTIESVEGTYLMRIGVAWEDPESAAFFANALADAIVARAETMSSAKGTQIAQSLVERLAAKKAQLAAVLRRSRDLKASIGVVDIDRQKQSLLEAQVAEQSRLTNDRADLQSSESQVAGLRREAGGKLSSAQQILEQTLAIEAPKAAGIKRGITIRESRVGQIDAQIATLGRNEDAIKALDDSATALQTEVTALTERVSFSQTENLANAPRIQIIERALPPLVRSSPKTLFNVALGFVAGCALAGCVLLLLGIPAEPAFDDRAAGGAEPITDAPMPPPAIAPNAIDAEVAVADPPSYRQWRAMGRASSRPADLTSEAAALPTGAVLASVPPAEALPPQATRPRVYPGVLPRPADGAVYADSEVAAIAPAIARWLGAPGDANRLPLLIAAADDDIDAQHLYQLLYDHFRASGIRVRTIDAASRPLAGWDADDRKPLIYAGGFGASGRLAVLGEIDAAMETVIVVPDNAADGDAGIDALDRCFGAMARRQPHVIAIAA